MSQGETLTLVLSITLGIAVWWHWYRPLRLLARFESRSNAYPLLVFGPPACFFALVVLLNAFAASDVRDSVPYLFFFTCLGALWVGAFQPLTIFLGISARDDGAERGNVAAAIAVTGGIVGLTLCYAGGSFGDGPGFVVVLFSAGLATVGFFASWWIVELVTGVAEEITVARNVSTGLRFAAFLVAIGVILMRAVAGDWMGFGATVADLRSVGWPVVFWIAAECAIGRARRGSTGVLDALAGLAYVGAAAVYVGTRGPW